MEARQIVRIPQSFRDTINPEAIAALHERPGCLPPYLGKIPAGDIPATVNL
jgi:hypothetical protein